MVIESERGILDLIGENVLEIERTNPLFNEQGSMSLPFSIKRTPKNDYILDFPDKYERVDKYNIKRSVNVRSGVMNENATLSVLSVDPDQIEGVFYLFESSFYNQVKEVKLPKVFDGVERWFQEESVPREERVLHILDLLNTMILSENDYNSDFTIFPVTTYGEVFTDAKVVVGAQTKLQREINELENFFPGDGSRVLQLLSKNAYKYNDDEGNKIEIPIGYGVSPFLRFNYVLRKIFEYFGFSLEQNLFDTDTALKSWVVLNNTMDAIMPGYFIESQLVPDCTVNDFLDVVRESLCADFFIDLTNKKAYLVLLNDVINLPPDLDLSEYLNSDYEKIELTTPKQVRLTYGSTSNTFASPPTDTLDDFLKKYPNLIKSPPLSITEGTFAYYKQNCIWKISDPEPQKWGWSSYKSNFIGSLNFNYDTSDDLEREEHKIPVEALACPKTLTGTDTLFHYTPVIGDGRNLNSFIIIDGKNQVEEATECPIMISLEHFVSPCRVGVQSTSDSYDDVPDPNISSLLFWGVNGLFNRYWAEYDKLLRTSFDEITYQLRLPAYLLNEFRFDRFKIIKGQPIMPHIIRYTVTNDSFVDVEMIAKTLKVYKEVK